MGLDSKPPNPNPAFYVQLKPIEVGEFVEVRSYEMKGGKCNEVWTVMQVQYLDERQICLVTAAGKRAAYSRADTNVQKNIRRVHQ